MDEKLENQEFELDDILKEFAGVEAPSEQETKEALAQIPELVEGLPELVEIPDVVIPVFDDTGVVPEALEVPEGETKRFELPQEKEEKVPTEAETMAIPVAEAIRAAVEEKKAEPAFDVPEEFTPNPGLFRSKLKELKKDLVAGPEKRYYELSEVGIGKLQIAALVNLIVTVLCCGVVVMHQFGMIPENRLKMVIFSQVLAMMVSGFLGSGLMVDALMDLFKGRLGMNFLLTVTFIACMVDGFFCLMDQRIPCCAAFSLSMTMALWAQIHKHNTESAQMDTLRKAVHLEGLVKGEHYFEGKDGLVRKSGQVSDFMEVYQKMSGPEMAQSLFCVLALLVCGGIAGFAGYRHGVKLGVQIFATSLLVAAPATFFVSLTRPMAILETRLHMVGTVICGWEGVKDLCGKAAFAITDSDLFPQGTAKLNGMKFYGDRTPDEVVSYVASLACATGGNLGQVFKQLRKSRNVPEYPVVGLRNYGDNGFGGIVKGESVLIGTQDFLKDMGVEIPEGTMVAQAVYASIDGVLSGVFAINYAKMRSASAGLVSLNGYRKIAVLKMPGDFMMTESFLRAKFNIKSKRFRFLDRTEAAQLKAYQPDPKEPVLALMTREDLVSAAYAITGARALKQATKLGLGIHLLGGILGMVIMLVLGYLGSVELLSPVHVLAYQAVWAVPGLLVTEWTRVV